MAWGNINERRERVKQMLKSGTHPRLIKIFCADLFSCSPSAVMADIYFLNGNVAHLNSSLRRRIRERDKYTCQYCGIENPKSGIIEHVIPFALGGCAKEYNLVFACQRCNTEKRRSVWVPDNLHAITKHNPDWRA